MSLVVSVRSVAFLLPQFHPIPENDAWWGPGFTEWHNVVRGRPVFPGHEQPQLPTDLGFYDLRLPETRAAQADLAQRYGIDAFCYYHYWFSGQRLLERPVDGILASGQPDHPFMLCWANESWRSNWDGRTGTVLVEQRYSPEDDLAHIRWLCGAFADDRYVRVDGAPIFAVYRASELPDVRRTVDVWRTEADRLGIGELHLTRVESFDGDLSDPRTLGFDSSIEFAPDWRQLDHPDPDLRPHRIQDYRSVASRMLAKPPVPWVRFPGVCPRWDNTPRRPEEALVLRGSTPALFEEWVTEVYRRQLAAAPEHDQLVFVNSWNEWAEGANLEPSNRWGRQYLAAHAAGRRRAARPSADETISIILLAGGSWVRTATTLEGILDTCGHLGRLDVTVIDNGSDDETQAALVALSDDLDSVRHDDALETPDVWFEGTSLPETSAVILLTDDIVLAPGWADGLLRHARARPDTVVAPVLTGRSIFELREIQARTGAWVTAVGRTLDAGESPVVIADEIVLDTIDGRSGEENTP